MAWKLPWSWKTPAWTIEPEAARHWHDTDSKVNMLDYRVRELYKILGIAFDDQSHRAVWIKKDSK